MRDLYIIGAGGFSIEVLFLIERFYKNIWNNIFLVDDDISKKGNKVRDIEIIFDLEEFFIQCNENTKVDVVITINKPSIRALVFNRIQQNLNNVEFPNIIDKTLIFDKCYSQIGQGNIIMDYVSITGNAIIGNFNIFGARTGIGHDSKIGNFNTFSPRVSISGGVSIGDGNSFGLNSSILQYKNVGNYNEIWSYTMILRNIKDNTTYFGIPAKKIKI